MPCSHTHTLSLFHPPPLKLLHVLLDKCGVTIDPTVMTHPLFNQPIERYNYVHMFPEERVLPLVLFTSLRDVIQGGNPGYYPLILTHHCGLCTLVHYKYNIPHVPLLFMCTYTGTKIVVLIHMTYKCTCTCTHT